MLLPLLLLLLRASSSCGCRCARASVWGSPRAGGSTRTPAPRGVWVAPCAGVVGNNNRDGGSMAVVLLVLVLRVVRASREVVVVAVAVAVGAPVVAGAGAVVATAAVVRAGRAGRCIVTRVCSVLFLVLFLVLFDGVNMFSVGVRLGSTTARAPLFFFWIFFCWVRNRLA